MTTRALALEPSCVFSPGLEAWEIKEISVNRSLYQEGEHFFPDLSTRSLSLDPEGSLDPEVLPSTPRVSGPRSGTEGRDDSTELAEVRRATPLRASGIGKISHESPTLPGA